MAKRSRNPKRKAPPWRFVSGAPAGYRKLKNRLTGKTRLIRMKRRRTGVSPVSRKKNPRRKRQNPVKAKSLAPGREVIFHGHDGKNYRATIKGRRKHGVTVIQYGVAGVGTVTAYVEDLKRLSPLPNPVRIRRTARGRFQVKSGKRLGTTRLRAMRQATLIRAPTGKPSIGARKKVAQLTGNNMLAFRNKRKWTVIRGSMKAGRFKVIKRGLSDGALKTWARSEKHQLRQM